MANTVSVRFNSVMLQPDGKMYVDAVLPDATHFRGVVEANLNREELALSLAHVDGERVIPGMTGAVEIDEEKWNAARASAKEAQAPADAEATAPSGKAEKAEKASK